MEERSFPNPFPDWDQGVLTSSPSAANSSTGDLFDADGKVSHAVILQNLTCIFLQVPPPYAKLDASVGVVPNGSIVPL